MKSTLVPSPRLSSPAIRHARLLFAFVATLAVSPPPAHAATVSWNVDTDGFWDVAANWNTGTVPQAGDDVVINRPSANVTVTFRTGTVTVNSLTSDESFSITGGALDLSSTSALANLTMSGGQLGGTGTVNVSGMITWNGGTMGDSGTTNANGGMTISGSTIGLRDGRTLNNAMTATWSGAGSFSNHTNTTFNNLNGASFEINTPADFNAGTFNNSGTITKTSGGGDGITRFAATLNNDATVVITSGELQLDDGGTHSGSFSIAASTTLELGGGTHTFSSAAAISGAGTMSFDAGTTNLNGGTYNVTGTTMCSGGTHTFSSAVEVDNTGAIVITSGTLNFSSGETIMAPTYTQSGGTLTGTDTVTVSGTTMWSGGIMSGQGVTNANGGLQLTNTSTLFLRDIRALNNPGVATWTGAGGFSNDTGASFNNLTGGMLNIQTAGDFFNGTLNNAGMITKTSGGGDGITRITGALNNTGMIAVTTGSMELEGGGTHTGTFTVAASATLELGGGTHTMTTGTLFSGMGLVRFAAGVVNFNAGTYNITGMTECIGGTHTLAVGATVMGVGMLEISGGTLNLESGDTITVPSYTQSSGTLGGSDTLNVSGTTTWSGGIMRGQGVTNCNGGMALINSGTISLRDNRAINNAATATWTGAGSWSNDTGTTFNNLMGATINIQTTGDFFNGTFNNAGDLTKSSGGGDGITRITATFNNTGSVEVMSGSLELENGGIHSGSFSVADLATLEFGGGTHNLNTGSAVSGAGRMRYAGGTINFNAGDYGITGITECAGGTTNFFTGVTVSQVGELQITFGTLNLGSGENPTTSMYTQSGGTLTGTDTLNVNGALMWSAGTMSGQGTTNANGGLQLINAGTISLRDTRTLSNAATATWTGAGAFSNDTGAVLRNLPSGTFAIQTSGDFFNGALDNQGTMTKTSGGGDGITRVNGNFTNSGTLEILSGTLRIESSYTQTAGETRLNGGTLEKTSTPPLAIDGGLLTGVGTIDGNVRVAGTVAPGLPVGELTIDGTYEQTMTGTLAVEIGGLTPVTQFDRLAVTGAATLAGTIDVALVNAFSPVSGNVFQILTYASQSGDFSAVSGASGFARNVTATFTELSFSSGPADTATPTRTPTRTATTTATASPTTPATNTPTATASPTPSPTGQDTATPTVTPTRTPTSSPTTPAATATPTPTGSATPSPGFTVTRTVVPLPVAPIAAGELGPDDAIDLVAGDNTAPKLAVLRNSGQAAFSLVDEVTIPGGSGGVSDVVLADMNGDDVVDAIAANPDGEIVAVALGNGQHELGEPFALDIDATPRRVAVGEVTGDDDLDVVVATDDRIIILRGGGDGTLSAIGMITTNGRPSDLIVGDFNADGDGDVLAALPSRNLVALYAGDGTGAFATGPSVTGNMPSALVLGVFTGDVQPSGITNTQPDLAVANVDSVAVYPPVPGGFASTPIVTAGVIASRIFAAEVTGDEFLDLIAVDLDTGVARALPGDGEGHFGDDPNFNVDLGVPLGGAAFADLNGDTAIDLVMTDPVTQELLIALNHLPEPPPLCVGDCNDDRRVSVNELITGVGIALERQPLSVCPQFDPNLNMRVEINELIRGVNNDLNGCPR